MITTDYRSGIVDATGREGTRIEIVQTDSITGCGYPENTEMVIVPYSHVVQPTDYTCNANIYFPDARKQPERASGNPYHVPFYKRFDRKTTKRR